METLTDDFGLMKEKQDTKTQIQDHEAYEDLMEVGIDIHNLIAEWKYMNQLSAQYVAKTIVQPATTNARFVEKIYQKSNNEKLT